MEYASDPAFCHVCGTRLVLREQPEDGPEPWCPTCGAWRYPGFSVGCSMIVYHPDGKRILTIDQYGKHGILVAGYVARGEDLESTVRREVLEETGLELDSVEFNASRFYEPSNTLMANFVCRATGAEARAKPRRGGPPEVGTRRGRAGAHAGRLSCAMVRAASPGVRGPGIGAARTGACRFCGFPPRRRVP